MDEVLRMIEIIEDIRQPWKVKHKLLDIVVIVLFAKLANADDWEEIEYCAEYNEDFLKQYIGLENGVPSHDTIERVMGMIDPAYMQKIYEKWNELVNSNDGEKLKKIISVDGKTMRGNATATQKAMYYNVLHFILSNMKHTIKVQIYDDGAVRLYQHDSWCSIWWDTPSCYTHPLNLYLLDKLIEFVKQYK